MQRVQVQSLAREVRSCVHSQKKKKSEKIGFSRVGHNLETKPTQPPQPPQQKFEWIVS